MKTTQHLIKPILTPRTDAVVEGCINRFPVHTIWCITQHAKDLEKELTVALTELTKIREAGNAVVDRWEIPLWKDVPPTAKYINALREAINPETAEPTQPEYNVYN